MTKNGIFWWTMVFSSIGATGWTHVPSAVGWVMFCIGILGICLIYFSDKALGLPGESP